MRAETFRDLQPETGRILMILYGGLDAIPERNELEEDVNRSAFLVRLSNFNGGLVSLESFNHGRAFPRGVDARASVLQLFEDEATRLRRRARKGA